MEQRLNKMIEQIDGLMADLRDAERDYAGAIGRAHETHRGGATNLVHYAALRNRDIRGLQASLASVGATRLTTTEPAVMARLQAARNVLSAYNDEDLKYGGDEVSDAFARADDVLEEHSNELLGESSEDTHSRIMVTLPTDASEDSDLVHGFAEAGMDLARINCAHDDPEAWTRMIDNVRAAGEAVGRKILVAMDLAGPKVRTGAIVDGPAIDRTRVTRTNTGTILTPSKLWLVSDQVDEVPAPPEKPGRATLTVQVDPEWLSALMEGSLLTFPDTRDSKRSFTVKEIHEHGVYAEGRQNAYLSNSTLIQHDWDRTRVSGIKPKEQKLRLHTGDTLILTTDDAPADPDGEGPVVLGCTLPEAVIALEVGHRVLFDDGAIEAEAVDKQSLDNGETEVTLDITRTEGGGTKLAAYKGINLPETDLPLPSLTAEDLEAFGFVARHADIVNVSFIRDADDVENLLDTLEDIAGEIEDESGPEAAERARDLGVVLKIETIPAYENLAPVLLAGMRHAKLGVMVARGDLAVELGFERMAEVPRLIMNMAESAHVPTVMATQVLENLAKSGLPSRAEITDAAYALRAESVMLNKGPHITDTIKILNRMSRKLGRGQRKNRIQLRRIGSWENSL